MTEAEQIMKRCQAGTRNYEEANNLHAACYGIIGKLLAQQEKDYERGFIGGMQKQMQSSVDKAVNRMAQPEQVIQDSTCSITLRLQGKPYPRTCKKCGLGPCIAQPMAQPEQEPPKYSFKAHWEKDGRIGVVGAVVRPDGGVHVLQDTIDPPEQEPTMWERRPDGKIGPTNALQRTWQGLTNDEIKEYLLKPVERDLLSFTRFIEAKLKQKNGYAEDKNT